VHLRRNLNALGIRALGGHVTQDRAEAFTQALVAVLILALEVEHTQGPVVAPTQGRAEAHTKGREVELIQDRVVALIKAQAEVLILALVAERTRVLEGPAVQLQARRIPISGTGLIPTARNSRLSIAQLSRTSPNDPSCFSED
jgi:hypothetical protein